MTKNKVENIVNKMIKKTEEIKDDGGARAEARKELEKRKKSIADKICNYDYYLCEKDEVTIRVRSKSMDEMRCHLKGLIGDWPRIVDGELFCVDGERLVWITKPTDMFGYCYSQGIEKDWNSKTNFNWVKDTDLLATLKNSQRRYDAVMDYPTFPAFKNTYYLKSLDYEKDSRHLSRLVSKFNPATPVDRSLIKAMFMTVFWGGQPGTRPLFVVDSDDQETTGGRGVGKTFLTEVVSYLVGGFIDINRVREFADVKKLLINSTGTERVVRFDNLKSNAFSWGDFEGLITTRAVTGHKLFVGNVTKPNVFTYLLTVNDAQISKDLATRAVIVKLRRPDYQADFADSIYSYIDRHRDGIISEIKDLIEMRPPVELEAKIRFPAWVRDVLSKVERADEALDLIKARADNADVDESIDDDFEEYLYERLADLRYQDRGVLDDASIYSYVLTPKAMREVLSEFTGERFSVRKVKGFLAKHCRKNVKYYDGIRPRGYVFNPDPGRKAAWFVDSFSYSQGFIQSTPIKSDRLRAIFMTQ